MPNVNSGIIKPSIKQEIFDSNRDLFDIIYFGEFIVPIYLVYPFIKSEEKTFIP